MGVQISLSVDNWRVNGNPNPGTDVDEILHAYPDLFKEGFGASLTPAPTPAWAWGT